LHLAWTQEYESVAKTMKRQLIPWLGFLLILVTLGGIHSVYCLTRFLWMASAEPTHRSVWTAQIDTWLAASLLLGVGWIILLMLLVREERAIR
jgi:hypothetical protein